MQIVQISDIRRVTTYLDGASKERIEWLLKLAGRLIPGRMFRLLKRAPHLTRRDFTPRANSNADQNVESEENVNADQGGIWR